MTHDIGLLLAEARLGRTNAVHRRIICGEGENIVYDGPICRTPGDLTVVESDRADEVTCLECLNYMHAVHGTGPFKDEADAALAARLNAAPDRAYEH